MPGTLAEVVAAGAGLPGRVYAQACDVESETDVTRLVDQAAANFGRIDVLVNNAAAVRRFDALDITADDWDRAMRTNVRGPYVAIRQAAPHMIRQRSGSIINITASTGLLTPPIYAPGLLAYVTSKAALNRLTAFLADELRPHGIAVNALSPGNVETEGLAVITGPVSGFVDRQTARASRVDPAKSKDVKPATPEAMGPPLLYLARQTAETLTGQIVNHEEFGKTWAQDGTR
jgi:NAD(P)-dependent dehydrogenase (short-subunit alcohol dehydrogenase family)